MIDGVARLSQEERDGLVARYSSIRDSLPEKLYIDNIYVLAMQ